MKVKRASGILMAMCVLAGSASGAVEASKGVDYYLIKDKEKLIHMSIEDYSNNFSSTSSNYYQHFLKDKYLEIKYLVQEQGRGPEVYSDDKYVYINDFLKNKTSNSESDSEVMGKTSGKSFDTIKDNLYKLSFENDTAVYKKLIDAENTEDEKTLKELIEILEKERYEVAEFNETVKAKLIEDIKAFCKDVKHGGKFDRVEVLSINTFVEGEGKSLLQLKLGVTEMDAKLSISKKIVDETTKLKRAKELIESNSPYTVGSENDGLNNNSKKDLLARLNKLLVDNGIQGINIEMDGLRVEPGTLEGENTVRLKTSDGKKEEAKIIINANFSTGSIAWEKRKLSSIQELNLPFNTYQQNKFIRSNSKSGVMFNKTFNDTPWTLPNFVTEMEITKTDNSPQLGLDLLTDVVDVELYSFDYIKVSEDKMFPEMGHKYLKVNNYEFGEYGNILFEIPLIFKESGIGYYYSVISNKNKQAYNENSNLYAMNEFENLDRVQLESIQNEMQNMVANTDRITGDYTIVFRLRMKYGNEFFLGVSTSYNLPTVIKASSTRVDNMVNK